MRARAHCVDGTPRITRLLLPVFAPLLFTPNGGASRSMGHHIQFPLSCKYVGTFSGWRTCTDRCRNQLTGNQKQEH